MNPLLARQAVIEQGNLYAFISLGVCLDSGCTGKDVKGPQGALKFHAFFITEFVIEGRTKPEDTAEKD